MKHESRLTPREQHQQQQQAAAESTTSTQGVPVDFETVEEALRHDRATTPVPPEIPLRLRASMPKETDRAPAPWWKRILGN